MIAPEVLINPNLLRRVQLGLGLERVQAGRHVRRDTEGRRIGEVLVRKIWAVEIVPPSSPASIMACVLTQEGYHVMAAFPTSDGVLLQAPLAFEPGWDDPVGVELSQFDLWAGDSGIPLSGCTYGGFIGTLEIQAAFRFSNPRTPARERFQRAIFDLARRLAGTECSNQAHEFFERWQGCLGRGEAP
jgi:hypothetical protein